MAGKNKKNNNQWPVKAVAPPKLSQMQWNLSMLLGLVFIVMAALQLISFTDFRLALGSMGLGSPDWFGAGLVLFELWAAASLFKLQLSRAFRMASEFFVLVVSGFWFYESIRMTADITGVTNSDFFGRFLSQKPGWWTVIESTIVLFWALWAVKVNREK